MKGKVKGVPQDVLQNTKGKVKGVPQDVLQNTKGKVKGVPPDVLQNTKIKKEILLEKKSNTGRVVTNWQDKWDVRVSLMRHGLEMTDMG